MCSACTNSRLWFPSRINPSLIWSSSFACCFQLFPTLSFFLIEKDSGNCSPVMSGGPLHLHHPCLQEPMELNPWSNLRVKTNINNTVRRTHLPSSATPQERGDPLELGGICISWSRNLWEQRAEGERKREHGTDKKSWSQTVDLSKPSFVSGSLGFSQPYLNITCIPSPPSPMTAHQGWPGVCI